MADENRQFDQQVHDAFERIELSDDAQERILANLLAAQGRRQSGEVQVQDMPLGEGQRTRTSQQADRGEDRFEVPVAVEGSDTSDDKVVPFTRRRFGWRMLLPLAAVLAVAVVVVQATSVMGDRKHAYEAPASSQSDAAYESKETSGAAEAEAIDVEDSAQPVISDEAAELNATDAAPMAAEESARDLTSVDYYPCVVLEDGTRLTALRDGLYTEEVPSDEVGELVGKATASSFDDPQNESAVPCTVYALKYESGAYAVQYESETTYWRCEPMG